MKKLVHFALAALFLLGISSAQNIPHIDVFGGFSYYSLDEPGNPSDGTTSTRLGLNGWDFSASFFRYHHVSIEADLSGHSVSNCTFNNSSSNFSCNNFSYMFGPRYNVREGHKLTGFVHALVGEDRATENSSGSPLSDTSLAIGAGVGVNYWVFRQIGFQLGPVDYIYTRHFSDFDLPSQDNFRASVGIVFRFGGESSGEPSPKSRPASAPSQPPPTVTARQPVQPGPTSVIVPGGRGMAIAALGIVVVPQEFDGAKILELDPGGVGEMASMKAGDLIKSVDGKPIRTPMELLAELSDKSGKVKIGIQRGDFATETLILLGTR
jgi:membrane-associated protease RseP (regulator of RpoE activity)